MKRLLRKRKFLRILNRAIKDMGEEPKSNIEKVTLRSLKQLREIVKENKNALF